MLHFLFGEIDWENGSFNTAGPEVDHFYDENGLGVTFSTLLQNHKPQMPSSACVSAEEAKNSCSV